MMQYRHEMKYIADEMELAIAAGRLAHLMELDKNAAADGGYEIRSLYFDDYKNTCYKENEAGTDPREKFRIRIYNHSTDRISLELKKKERGKTLKLSCPLTIEQCEALIRGECLPFSKEHPPVLQKLCMAVRTRLMKPVIIVDYYRIPYVCQEGNVRVTLDRQISSSVHTSRFLEPVIPKRTIMPAGKHVLEVKYDEFLPDVIAKNLELGTLRQTSFSKYYLCRRYN